MSEVHQEFQSLKDKMSEIDRKRGGSASGLKGFYAEAVNASEDNIRRINEGIAARQVVIDNNGGADAVIRYANGQYGREIQYKNGYRFSMHKKFLSSGKYDGMIYAVNNDNPVLANQKQMEVLNAIAKEHNIKLVAASVSDAEMKILSELAYFEGGIRSKIGIDDTPGITLELYVSSKEAAYNFEKLMAKRKEFNRDIVNKTSAFLKEDFARINSVGVSQALSAAQFAAAMSVAKNTISVVKGEEDLGTATKNILKETSTAAVVGYATGNLSAIMGNGNISDAALLVNGTIQISKQVCAYAKGEINEEQLIQNVAEMTVYLTAAYIGKTIGCAIGSAAGPIGAYVGQFVGEMITTAFCSTIIDTIQKEKRANEYHKKMLALAHRAEYEIRESQSRLIILTNEKNMQFVENLNNGYEKFMKGIKEFDYITASEGLLDIGKEFGVAKEKLTQGYVVKGNIFGKKDRVIKMG